jgi:serine/threonine protein kinase
VLAQRYRLESVLGAGAFGVVWRARHVHLDMYCAVKVFDPPPGADARDTGARFLQEARLMARLKCPNIAQVFDYGVHEEMPFLVLELLEGRSLRSLLDWLKAQGRLLSPPAVATILRHVAEALNAAHSARVVHRDLKPENIFLAQEGDAYAAKVLDFGIAKWSIDTAPHLTATATLMGTAHYMCPEQFENAKDVDHRADLWSLGVIAFECLTGELPFPGDTLLDVAFRVCKEGPRTASQLAHVPAGFDAWFRRATAYQRELRFDSALEQARALRALCVEVAPPEALPAPAVELAVEQAPPFAGQLASETVASQPLPPPGNAHLAPSRLRWLAKPLAPRRRRVTAGAGALVALLAVVAYGMCNLADYATVAPSTAQATLRAAPDPEAAEPSLPAPPGTPAEQPAAEAPGEQPSQPRQRVRRAVAAEQQRPSEQPGNVSSGPGLDATAIQRTVRKYSPAVRQNCWQRALNARAPGVPSSAKVTAQITIDPSGRVSSVTASGAPRGYAGLANCIEDAVKGWTFPRSSGETVTNVPFMFVGQ